jgi:hypothetical protein
MNERIQKLAEQATTYIEPTSSSGEGWIFNKEKFADLLVWECMKICEDAMKKDNSALACWSAIKGTFRS